MTTYGHVIKFERMRQNIKQVELAKDICSPAYLSKIESNSIVPSEDVIKSLFAYLKLSIPSHTSSSDEEFIQKVQSIYYEALKKKDREKIEHELVEIGKELFIFSDHEKYFTYLLMLIRLKILVQDIKHDTYSFISAISSLSKDFNAHQLFLLNSCIGYFHYYKNEFVLALASFEKALEFHTLTTVQECETADFYYGISTMYLQNQKIMETLEYNDKALAYFNREFLYFRAIESHIIKAICYKRTLHLDQSLDNLRLAEKISKHHKATKNLPIIYINIASIYALKLEFSKSIDYHLKCLKEESAFDVKLTCVYCLVIENAKIKSYAEVLKWSNYGMELYKNNPVKELKSFHYHFKCYISLHSDYKEFTTVVNEAIEHFVTVKDYRHAHKYALLLANYYNTNLKYKKACTYFSLANTYLSKKEKLQFIEDI